MARAARREERQKLGLVEAAPPVLLALLTRLAVDPVLDELIPSAGTSGDGYLKPLCREQQRRANL